MEMGASIHFLESGPFLYATELWSLHVSLWLLSIGQYTEEVETT